MEPSSADTDPILAELEERLANPPTIWTPEGVPDQMDAAKCDTTDRVTGIVQSVEDRESDFGPYRVVILRRSDGSRVQVAGMGAVLQGRFTHVQIGDGLAILFKGRVEPKTPGFKPYADFMVERIAAHPEEEQSQADHVPIEEDASIATHADEWADALPMGPVDAPA